MRLYLASVVYDDGDYHHHTPDLYADPDEERLHETVARHLWVATGFESLAEESPEPYAKVAGYLTDGRWTAAIGYMTDVTDWVVVYQTHDVPGEYAAPPVIANA